MEMAAAMQRAGMVTQDQVDEQRKIKVVVDEFERRYDLALQRLDLREEIVTWMEDTGRLVPIEVLDRWCATGKYTQKEEWAKWLCAYRESAETSTNN